MMAALCLALTSCEIEEDYHPQFLQGHWVSVANSKEQPLILVFDDDYAEVKNSSYSYSPFTSDYCWNYHMSDDSVLRLYRSSDYDDDGIYYSESMDFDLYLTDNGRMMTLVYTPSVGHYKSFSFIHR